MTITELMARYQADNRTNVDAANRILANAKSQGRENLTDAEGTAFDTYQRQAQKAQRSYEAAKELAADEARTDASLTRNTPTNAHSVNRGHSDETVVWRNAEGEDAQVHRGQSFASHPVVAREVQRTAERDKHITGMHGDFGQMLRAMSTTTASAVVPVVWSADVIDKARNAAVVMNAGATVVPMPAKTYQIGRLTGDATPAYKNEGAPVTPADVSFDYIQLVSTSLTALVVASVEWVQDAPNSSELLTNSIAAAMALELDKAALFGQLGATGTNDEGAGFALPAPYPMGLLKNLLTNAPGQVLGFATNGTAPTAGTPYGEILAALYAVRTQNEKPNAFVSNDKMVQSYQSMTDSTNQPLRAPDVVSSMEWLTTNGIPSYTRGTMTNTASDLFVGDWSQLLVGQRMAIEIRTLQERYSEAGQVGFLAYYRGDIAVARPKAFACYRALKGA